MRSHLITFHFAAARFDGAQHAQVVHVIREPLHDSTSSEMLSDNAYLAAKFGLRVSQNRSDVPARVLVQKTHIFDDGMDAKVPELLM